MEGIIATKAHIGDRVNLILSNQEGHTNYWLIQKEDEPEFYFSVSHNWTTDPYNRKEFWYYHHAINMAEKRGFDIIDRSQISHDIIDDDLIISMNDTPIETVHNIRSNTEVYLRMNYAFKI